MKNTTKEIPIFFASDDNYVPLLATAIKSLLSNASKNYTYKIYVLTTTISQEKREKIVAMATENSTIEFVSLTAELDKLRHLFKLRDYYSQETYYRFFIPNLFPKYKKIIYLDCDIIVKGDISELYNIDLGNNYVAAAPEEVFILHPNWLNYPRGALGIEPEDYFNAGVMLLNTERMLKDKIAEKFVALAEKYTFRIVQDEDYLNVLLRDHKMILPLDWNKTAFKNDAYDDKNLKIIHYKIIWRPWHYENVLYENLFWFYAKQTDFYLDLKDKLAAYDDKAKQKDKDMFDWFVTATKEDAESPNSYRLTHKKVMKEGGFFIRKLSKISKLKKVSKLIGIKGHRSVYGSRKK